MYAKCTWLPWCKLSILLLLELLAAIVREKLGSGVGGYIACRHDGISPSPEGDSFDLQALFFRRFSMCCGQFFMLILLYIVRAFV